MEKITTFFSHELVDTDNELGNKWGWNIKMNRRDYDYHCDAISCNHKNEEEAPRRIGVIRGWSFLWLGFDFTFI